MVENLKNQLLVNVKIKEGQAIVKTLLLESLIFLFISLCIGFFSYLDLKYFNLLYIPLSTFLFLLFIVCFIMSAVGISFSIYYYRLLKSMLKYK